MDGQVVFRMECVERLALRKNLCYFILLALFRKALNLFSAMGAIVKFHGESIWYTLTTFRAPQCTCSNDQRKQ